jgi:hypothetical protein
MELCLSSLQIRNSENDARYLQTYQVFLNFFKERIAVEDVAANDAKIAVVLVYSWMGRAQIDPACWNNFERARTALQHIRRGEPKEQEIEDIKSFVGNSLIATSKFLHFLAPKRYAIWDRYVAWAAYRYEYPYPYQYNKIDRYLVYLRDLETLEINEEVCQQVRKTLKDEVSSLRMKEFALFHLGISERSE